MILLRFLLLALVIAGIGLLFGYPRYLDGMSRQTFGTWRVYDVPGGFRPAAPLIAGETDPSEVLVDMTVDGSATFDGGPVLEVSATSAGKPVLDRLLTFEGSEAHTPSPQAFERVYRASAGVIGPRLDNPVLIAVTPAGGDLPIRQINVLLRRLVTADPRIKPAAFTMIAVGFVGFVLAMRPGRPRNPNSQPPPPRWGRNAGRRE